MNAPETKKDQIDACGRRGGGGCSPATPGSDPLMAPHWGFVGLIEVSLPSAKAFVAPSTDKPQ